MSLLDENFDIDIKDLIISGLKQLLKDPDDNSGSIGYRKLHPAISTAYTDYGYLQITINEIINGKLDLIHIR